MSGNTLLIFGFGYTGKAIGLAAAAHGFAVTGTSRNSGQQSAPPGIAVLDFAAAAPALATATHLLATAPPDESGDPVLARYAGAIRSAPALRWIGYLSTTGVYGDRDGGWVDERTSPAPTQPRSRARLAAEEEWIAVAQARALDLFRVAGIYGPGRAPFAEIRSGRARRVLRPGHATGRIHRDDIAAAVLAAMRQEREPGARVLNLADDEPAESASVLAEAARLLGLPAPPSVPYEQVQQQMSEMRRSFWADNRKVASRATKAALGIAWRYPTYREGLRAILAEESGEHAAE